MRSIIDQQIELHFGDEYKPTIVETRKYIAACFNNIRKWGGDTQAILDSEGGRKNILRTALATIIEVGTISEGLERWSKRLTNEYVNSTHLKKCVPLELEKTSSPFNESYHSAEAGSGTVHSSFGDGSPHSRSATTLLYGGDEDRPGLLRGDEEKELFGALAQLPHSDTEVADLLGWPIKRVKTVKARVVQRARYNHDPDYRRKKIARNRAWRS